MNKIVVNRAAAQRLRLFFPWVYRTDIRQAASDAGDIVSVHAPDGDIMGNGYIKPDSENSERNITV